MRSACRMRARTIWLYRIPSLIGAIGAVLLTYWAALAFVTRRAALLAALDDGDARFCSGSRRGSPRPTPCCCSPWSPRWARWRAPISPSGRQRRGIAGWALPAIFWTALAAGMLLKGPLIVMVVGLDRRGACRSSTARCAGSQALRPLPGVVWFCLLVLPWFVAIMQPHRRKLLRRVGRARSAEQGVQRPGGARRAAGLLFRCCSG